VTKSLRFAHAGSGVRRGVLVAVVLGGSLGIWQGVAGAARTSIAAIPIANIEFHNANCGDTTGAAVIGTVKFERKPTKLNIRWRVTSGPPSTKYSVSLYEYAPTNCIKLADLGTVKTNSKGVGKKTFSYPNSLLAGVTSVFVDGYDGSSDNNSVHVDI
jgi:hypothetical protein